MFGVTSMCGCSTKNPWFNILEILQTLKQLKNHQSMSDKGSEKKQAILY